MKPNHYRLFEFLDISLARDIHSRLTQDFNILQTQEQSPTVLRSGSPGMLEKDSRDRTILIVEDSDDARYFMRLALEDLGYIIVEAENGAKAVEMAESERPDIILMDLSLPIMDGLAATEKIRKSDGLGKVPIVAVTAHQETDFRAGAKAAGFNAYVTKPI
ncbi:MAG TPA: response regulator, partial [Pyrinomonadaceae bacterium]|nr:response regulator [Pyrinomonadaceae bacterium]